MALTRGSFEQGVDALLVAVHDVEHARRQPGLEEELGDAQRHRGVALGRLQDERVAGRDAPGPIFHSGIIAGKLNGVMPATTPSGWRIE